MVMESSYRLTANELDENFIAGIKAAYKDKNIEIIVYEIDETEYLLGTEANKQRLLQSKKNIENRQNLVEIDLADIE